MRNPILRQHEDAKPHVLVEVSREISSLLDMDQLLVQGVRLIRKTFGFYHVGVDLIEGSQMYYRVVEEITARAAGTAKPALASNLSTHPRYLWMEGSQTRSDPVVTLMVHLEEAPLQ
jgi:hypothetical protein